MQVGEVRVYSENSDCKNGYGGTRDLEIWYHGPGPEQILSRAVYALSRVRACSGHIISVIVQTTVVPKSIP
jgi:hypothetical protein